ncbi:MULTISPECIES: hypothetical protein [Ralstonia solanacearum species complex]|uniref:Type III effector protein n=2 Tax=Ralstonia solanacearum species complex TaxID=3116862 RepID=A0A0S4V6P7_RALSL|nr:hypothetical protein [Ralstonia pseudosolanacearum]NKA03866.1 RipQ-effector family protein [Ralstonia solanacearum]MDK1379418.1 hypothetical protein [Ralstonia pseudosolanacearum]NKA11084.1 RipQ-effector family protein [Ralstonia solanacearum]NKA54254.1 RipQ-effector family protein [Ralstonia solanacearum]NKA67016.1 RipQ-effector family protein [Ralstonia solanacearum]
MLRTSLDRASGVASVPTHPQEATGSTPAPAHTPSGRAPSAELSALRTLSSQSSRTESGRLSIGSQRQPASAQESAIEMASHHSPTSPASPRALLSGQSERSNSDVSQWFSAAASIRAQSIGSIESNSPPGGSPPHTADPGQTGRGIDIPHWMPIADQLRDIFRPHFDGTNDAQFEILIQQRAERLQAMGETPATVAAVLAKGANRDRLAQTTVGFVRSVPFGIASRLFDVKQALTAFAKTTARVGATVGAGSGTADAFGGTLLGKATSNTQWLAASPDHLEPVMARAHKAVQPSLGRLAAEVSLAFQAYSLRNVIRTGVAPLATHALGAARAANVDSWIAAVGGPVAGAAAYMAMQHMNETHHRTGAEYLLGRTDWEDQFKQLKQSTWTDPLVGAGKRTAKLLVADLATETLAATRSLFTATNLIKNMGALAGGFAGVLTAQTAAGKAATEAGYTEAAVAAVRRAVSTVLSAPVYAAWTTADVMAGPAIDAAAGHIQQAFTPLMPHAAPPAHTAIDMV